MSCCGCCCCFCGVSCRVCFCVCVGAGFWVGLVIWLSCVFGVFLLVCFLLGLRGWVYSF